MGKSPVVNIIPYAIVSSIVDPYIMKKIAREWIRWYLTKLAKYKLKKINPVVIGITGTFGKTGMKEFLAQALSGFKTVKAPQGSYNSEFGIPLMILGQTSPMNHSVADWWGLIVRATKDAFSPEVYDLLIVEMGVDRPGDMDALLTIITPQICIYTSAAKMHVGEDNFATQEESMKEEAKALHATWKHGGTIVYHADYEQLRQEFSSYSERVLTYALDHDASMQAHDIKQSLRGLSFEVAYLGQQYHIETPILGRHHIGLFMGVYLVGQLVGIPLDKLILESSLLTLPPGRMTVFDAINQSTILDSSYNSGPHATKAALDTLKEVATGRKIACLGQMNELGPETVSDHREVGRYASLCADVIIGVAPLARVIVEEAEKMQKESYYFETSLEAATFLKTYLKPGDTMLVKGSQNQVRLERLIAQLLANPEDTKRLTRQGKEWSHIS